MNYNQLNKNLNRIKLISCRLNLSIHKKGVKIMKAKQAAKKADKKANTLTIDMDSLSFEDIQSLTNKLTEQRQAKVNKLTDAEKKNITDKIDQEHEDTEQKIKSELALLRGRLGAINKTKANRYGFYGIEYTNTINKEGRKTSWVFGSSFEQDVLSFRISKAGKHFICKLPISKAGNKRIVLADIRKEQFDRACVEHGLIGKQWNNNKVNVFLPNLIQQAVKYDIVIETATSCIQ